MTPEEGVRTRTIRTDSLARVEGEGAHVRQGGRRRGGRREASDLRAAPFFEAFLRGRSYTEPPDITARICGICPVAYQMSACNAIEDACGVTVDGPLRDLRRMIYCGEWVESHALHIFMLHAPDFLGYESAIEMAKDHRGVVEQALRIKKAGNELIRLIGGREVHPINVRDRRLLPRTDQSRAPAPARAARAGSRGGAASCAMDGGRSTSRNTSATWRSYRCRAPASTRSTVAASFRIGASTSPRTSSRSMSWRSTSSIQTRSTRGSANAARTSLGRWLATS